eukprot:scaffold186477_cov86-Cyclotella_meneghiniana.AAC.1
MSPLQFINIVFVFKLLVSKTGQHPATPSRGRTTDNTPVQSDLADIQTRTRQLDGAMRCIDECCRKVVLNFHAAYIAAFAGSDVKRLKEQEHLPEPRIDLRSFFYTTENNDDARFALQTLVIDKNAKEFHGYFYPGESDENWVKELLDSGWRELLLKNPLTAEVQHAIAHKLNVRG